MDKIKTFVIVSVAIFLAAGVAFAQPGQGKGASRQKGFKEAMQSKLGLTEEQKQKLDENREAQDVTMKGLHESMKKQREKLQEALKNPGVTRASIEPIVAEMKSLQAQLIDHRINAIFTAKSILTPEQFAKFNEMIEKRFEEKKEGMHERMKERRGQHQDAEKDGFPEEPPPPPGPEEL